MFFKQFSSTHHLWFYLRERQGLPAVVFHVLLCLLCWHRNFSLILRFLTSHSLIRNQKVFLCDQKVGIAERNFVFKRAFLTVEGRSYYFQEPQQSLAWPVSWKQHHRFSRDQVFRAHTDRGKGMDLSRLWNAMWFLCHIQSLEFVAEMRILTEMKTETRRKKLTSILFSMKIKIMDLWMQIESTKLIFTMNFSVLYFF